MPQAPDTRTRVLVLAPTGRDGDAAADQLGAAGLTAVVCKDMLQLIEGPAGRGRRCRRCRRGLQDRARRLDRLGGQTAALVGLSVRGPHQPAHLRQGGRSPHPGPGIARQRLTHGAAIVGCFPDQCRQVRIARPQAPIRDPGHAGGPERRGGAAAPVHRACTCGDGHAGPADALSRREPPLDEGLQLEGQHHRAKPLRRLSRDPRRLEGGPPALS